MCVRLELEVDEHAPRNRISKAINKVVASKDLFSLTILDLRPVRHWSVSQITRRGHTGQLLGGVVRPAHLLLSHKDPATGHHEVGVSQHDQEAQSSIT